MKRRRFEYRGLAIVLVVYLLIAAVLFTERTGIQYEAAEPRIAYLDDSQVVLAKDALAQQQEECLVLIDSQNSTSVDAVKNFERIFLDMKVRCRWLDIRTEEIPDYDQFRTVVVLMDDLDALGKHALELSDWVEAGGRVMYAMTLLQGDMFNTIKSDIGIGWCTEKKVLVDSVCMADGFMLGGDGIAYEIWDGYDAALDVRLLRNATLRAWVDDDEEHPLIWTTEHGKGRFVVVNFGFYEKSVRGFYAAAYSMLEDAFAYPVLNGATFYLDDFPSPVPGGDGHYIREMYNMDIDEFYTNVWWPETLALAQKYGVVYTAVVIQNYDDDTSGNIVPQLDENQFHFFGNQVLRYQGEIGYHGYNHQPLCLGNVDYGSILPYYTWESEAAMEKSVRELIDFTRRMFPKGQQSVYVPPSNVLSDEGRRMLAEKFPEIKTVASNYSEGELAYAQEFEVAEDGVVEQPRDISGLIIDAYMERIALSELNMHLVSNHFMHPDDLLDEARGAAIGWEKLKARMDEFMGWLFGSVPCLRRLTGSELSGAIQRWGSLSVQRECEEEKMTLTLDNYVDEAYLLVRLEGKQNPVAEGGTLTQLTESLYLLSAEGSNVTVTWDR